MINNTIYVYKFYHSCNDKINKMMNSAMQVVTLAEIKCMIYYFILQRFCDPFKIAFSIIIYCLWNKITCCIFYDNINFWWINKTHANHLVYLFLCRMNNYSEILTEPWFSHRINQNLQEITINLRILTVLPN